MQIYGIFFILLIRNNKSMISSKLKDQILIKQKGKCGLCKSKFNKHIPHEIHHLNHNSSDNNIHNLIALCSNCHHGHHRYNISIFPYFSNLNLYNISNDKINPYYKYFNLSE
jgi:hypothetical protein